MLLPLIGLRGAGAEIHYIYIPCSPIKGNSIYWKPLSYGIDMGDYLRAHLSDRAIPRICTATPIGKLDWFSSGWAVERVAGNDSFLWLRTPYTPEFFKDFAPFATEQEIVRVNAEGTLDIQYLAEIGNEAYLAGARPERTGARNPAARPEDVDQLRRDLADTPQTARSIVDTGLKYLCRSHKTRVEIDFRAGEEAFNYIAGDDRITDVVISSEKDVVDHLPFIRQACRRLAELPHVSSVRLRSMKFATAPARFSRGIIEALADLNRVRTVKPLRLEVETWFLLPEDITAEHAGLARRLNNRGITVYGNVPLLGGVNDNAPTIQEISYALRRAGIEFHHLYVAGLPIQEAWNLRFPVDSYEVTDIATLVRRQGSGREIPRYIISTGYGEVDYGLSSSLLPGDKWCRLKLNCYDKAYYREMNPYYAFPQELHFDDEKPVVEVPGLVKNNPFPVS